MAQLITVEVPEYTIDSKPDYLAIGGKVDRVIEEHFDDGQYICRAIGKDDHPNLTVDDLITTILTCGTDKYDPAKKGVCHEEFAMYDHDFQGEAFDIKHSKIVVNHTHEYPTFFGDTVQKFYEKTMFDRGYAVRIDLLMIYDAHQLQRAKKINDNAQGVGSNLEQYLYKFKDRKRKHSALLAIINIGRGSYNST